MHSLRLLCFASARRLMIGVLCATGVTGCVHVKVETRVAEGSEAAAVREARAAQNRAIAVWDPATVAGYWTEDVTVRRALGQPLAGRDAARAIFELKGPRDSAIVYQRLPRAVEISTNWPLAFETGEWSGHLGSVTGPVIIGGRYSAQWVKRDGRWLIRSEVFVPLHCAGTGCNSKAVP
jgi:ketosteroid isomerase-like protein